MMLISTGAPQSSRLKPPNLTCTLDRTIIAQLRTLRGFGGPKVRMQEQTMNSESSFEESHEDLRGCRQGRRILP